MNIVRLASGHMPSTPVDIAIVIDVFRFSTTVATLFARGLDRAMVIGKAEDLAAMAAQEYLIFSELDELAHRPDRVDNSPTIASNIDLQHRSAVLATRNGTRALVAAVACARQVWIASFLNLRAVANRVAALRPQQVALLPAGDFQQRQPRIEDECCADALTELLHGNEPAFEYLFQRIRADERVQRRLSREPPFVHDMELALRANVCTVIPHTSALADCAKPPIALLSVEQSG